MTGFRLISCAEEAALHWNSVLELQPEPCPFDDFEFVESLAELFGWETRTYVVDDVLSAHLIIRSRGPIRDVVVPPFTPYSALLAHPNATKSEIGEAFGSLTSRTLDLPHSRLFSINPASPMAALAVTGYERGERFTPVLKTACVEDAIPAWSSSTRRTFRKFRSNYDFISSGVDVGAISGLTERAYLAAGHKMALPAGVLSHFANGLVSRGLSTAIGLIARDSGTLEAGIVLLTGQTQAWYWMAGSVRGPAMTVLMGHAQEYLFERKITRFDLMGANTPHIAEFKRRFGGLLAKYPHLVRSSIASKIINRISEGGALRPDRSPNPGESDAD